MPVQLYSIGIVRTHIGTSVTARVRDLQIAVLNTPTGEILRELTLDPTRHYQPRTAGNP